MLKCLHNKGILLALIQRPNYTFILTQIKVTINKLMTFNIISKSTLVGIIKFKSLILLIF